MTDQKTKDDLKDLVSKAQESWEEVKDVASISNRYQKAHSEALNDLERELEDQEDEENSEENSEEDDE